MNEIKLEEKILYSNFSTTNTWYKEYKTIRGEHKNIMSNKMIMLHNILTIYLFLLFGPIIYR